MSYEERGFLPLDYRTATLAGSPLRFRGPLDLEQDRTIVCLGGSETFGRFIETPYPARLCATLQRPVVNLGVVNAGLDVLIDDPGITTAVQKAEAVVFQLPGTQNMSNRFYTVHRRRNDRFLCASDILRTIYPDVDFTEFHFTRHLLSHLAELSKDRFEILRGELRTAWVARMRRFMATTGRPVHLLWLSNRQPNEGASDPLGRDPLFVDQDMVDAVARDAASFTIAVPEDDTTVDATKGKRFAMSEEAAARALPGPALHDRAAKGLLAHLS